ncbi:MAG TPA: hypothetical protein VIG72_04285, partial [Pontibacter sp.]
LNAQQPLWLEDESMTIGRIVMPHELYTYMQERPTIVMHVPQKLRIRKLALEYCRTDKAKLEAAILKIRKRLGGLATQEALHAIATGDMEKMVEIALSYYDKAYQYQLKPKNRVYELPLQTIDLEGLANHKGSAFGSIGMPEQPTTEQFENMLGTELLQLNAQQPLWLEDESMTIGRIVMPHELYTYMQERPTIVMHVPQKLRIRKLALEYCRTDKAKLEAAILKIRKRLGGLATQEALHAIATGDMEKMVEIALSYYDKAYQYQLKPKNRVYELPLQTIDPDENAQQIIAFARNNNLL